MKRCAGCQRMFKPSSRHLLCPARRSRSRCACGAVKQLKSATCGSCREHGGPRSGNWRGGKTRHKAGYVMMRAPEQPRAKSNGGYVFEHILVMEDLLGRRLFPDESVHHRNGVRDDNRVDNLELWVKPQPSGIRVEDAIAWASEILRRYKKGPLSPPTGLEA